MKTISLCICILFTAAATVAQSGWQTEAVDSGGGGKYTSLRVDSSGNYHVSYTDERTTTLKYAFLDRALKKWFTMPVDKTAGFCSLAVDSHKRPHISYNEYGTGRLKYAYWTGSQWIKQVIPLAAKEVTFYTSIALDQSDRPTISYYEYIGADGEDFLLNLRSVRWNGQVWELSTIDRTRGTGKFNQIVADSKGGIHAAYADVSEGNHGIRYAYRESKSWTVDILEGAFTANTEHVGWSAAIALDQQGRPHLAYTNQDRRLVRYAFKDEKGWHLDTIDALRGYAYPDRYSVAIDSDGQPYISYYDSGRGELRVAHRKDVGKWSIEVVDQNYAGFTSSLQVAGNDLIVTYFNSVENSLMFARRAINPGGTDDNQGGAARRAQGL